MMSSTSRSTSRPASCVALRRVSSKNAGTVMTAWEIGPSRRSASCFSRSSTNALRISGGTSTPRILRRAVLAAHVALEAFDVGLGGEDAVLDGFLAHHHAVVVEKQGAGRQQVARAVEHRGRPAGCVEIRDDGIGRAQVDSDRLTLLGVFGQFAGAHGCFRCCRWWRDW